MEGRVEIYCGQGRGKTSCAIGQCVKAAGQEKQIIMVQFLKGKETEELVEMLENRSDDQLIIMTGRQIPEALIPYADAVYEISTIKES